MSHFARLVGATAILSLGWLVPLDAISAERLLPMTQELPGGSAARDRPTYVLTFQENVELRNKIDAVDKKIVAGHKQLLAAVELLLKENAAREAPLSASALEAEITKLFEAYYKGTVQLEIRELEKDLKDPKNQPMPSAHPYFARLSANWVANAKSLNRDIIAAIVKSEALPAYRPNLIDAVRTDLLPKEVFVEFAKFDANGAYEETYGRWVVAAKGISFKFLDAKEIGAQKKKLVEVIAEAEQRQDTPSDKEGRWTQDNYDENLQSFHDIAAKLRTALIDSTTDTSANSPQGLVKFDSWILAPSADIWLVPFAALPESEPAAKLEKVEYAIDRHLIRYTISARDVLTKFGPGQRRPHVLLTNPQFNVSGSNAGSRNSFTANEESSRFDDLAPGSLEALAAWDEAESALLDLTPWLRPSWGAAMHTSCPLFRRRRRMVCTPCPTLPPAAAAPGTFGGPGVLSQGSDNFPKTLRLLDTEAAKFGPALMESLNLNGQSRRYLAGEDAKEGALGQALMSPYDSKLDRSALVVLTHGIHMKSPSDQDPLLYCGLGLTGFDLAAGMTEKPPPTPAPDGYISGREVVALHEGVAGRDVIFLVACETGAGAINGGQLASMRHAFTLGGARTVIATSWKVPARESIELAQTFFGVQWKAGTISDPYTALHESQKSMIKRLRTGHRVGNFTAREMRAHPYFWASFSATGIE